MTKYAAIRELHRLKVFIIISLGQFVSIVGSGLTSFALDLWVYQQTGSVTQYALIGLFNLVPPILISPIAGAFVDRWDRRWTMIISDFVAALATLFIALLFFTSRLQVWYICAAISVISVCNLFQRLASTTATTLLVPKKHLGRASGILQIGESITELFIPALAGILVLTIQLQGIFLIDFITYFFSLATLLIVKFPKLKTTAKTTKSDQGIGSLISDLVYSWNYTIKYPGLLGLLLYFAITNFIIGTISILLIPMLLTFVSSATAGSILSIGGIGTLVGSLLMGIWGGPKRSIYGILGFGMLLGVCIFSGGLRPSTTLITASIFGGLFCFTLIAGCSEALLLRKVAPDVQGRVFALMGMITSSSVPLAYLLAGPLADYVFEPLLANGGLLAGSVGSIIGVGKGRGIGLLFIVLGILQITATIYSYLYPHLKKLDPG
ncbi:MFS transporter [Nostoc sp. MG11]|uniref:MFS transporter n=1 Tax=Nostoc sp. MG11 TaxID=2721166 RepID=UPI0018661253|nr:MFS transporter [Nostoc sp. MG11]